MRDPDDPARATSTRGCTIVQRQLGSPEASAGTFGGRKVGALDPTSVKNTTTVAVDKGAGGLFTADDMRIDIVSLSAAEHALLLLGSSGLYKGVQPLDLAKVASAHNRDTAAASAAGTSLASVSKFVLGGCRGHSRTLD